MSKSEICIVSLVIAFNCYSIMKRGKREEDIKYLNVFTKLSHIRLITLMVFVLLVSITNNPIITLIVSIGICLFAIVDIIYYLFYIKRLMSNVNKEMKDKL